MRLLPFRDTRYHARRASRQVRRRRSKGVRGGAPGARAPARTRALAPYPYTEPLPYLTSSKYPTPSPNQVLERLLLDGGRSRAFGASEP